MKRKMKDSGVEWLGDIPADWDLVPARNLFSEVKDKNTDGKVTRQFSFRYGKIVDKDKGGRSDVTTDETITAYRIVTPDTIMINGLNLNYDFISQRVAIVEERGIITSAYLALCPNKKLIEPAFAVYLFKGYDSKQVFHGHGSGIRKTLNYSDFKEIKTVCPDLSTQRKISAYLDARCAKIDEMISDAKKTIEEYKAWKASVIFEAVTGKNTGSKMKDSGVEWIGKVPERWQVCAFKHRFKIILGKMLCSERLDASYSLERYFCAANVHYEGGVDASNLKEMWFSEEEKKIYKVHEGDLLVVEGGAGAGGAAVVKSLSFDAYVQNSILIARSNDQRLNRFGAYVLELLVGRGYVGFVCNKATIPHFTKEKLSSVPLPVMPIQEMHTIVARLDKKCAAIDRVIAEKEALIADLEAYKKSLIFECVTGKMEVA